MSRRRDLGWIGLMFATAAVGLTAVFYALSDRYAEEEESPDPEQSIPGAPRHRVAQFRTQRQSNADESDAVIEKVAADRVDERADVQFVEQEPTPEEKAAAAYESMFEKLTEKQSRVGWRPTSSDGSDYKAAFDALTDEQKLEQIPHALNLLSDDSYGLLKAILMDPKEPQEVLERIYYDLLNRDEELKHKLLSEVHAVPGHPLYSEIEDLNAMLD